MDVECTFKEHNFDHGETVYCCSILDKVINDNEELFLFGEHLNGKSNTDVQGVQFFDCNLTKVPAGITKIFANLKMLAILSSGLKRICKDDLVEYKNIEKFICNSNKLVFLPGNLFDDFENLEWIELWNNNIKLIEPNIFDNLKNLKYVDIEQNPKYDKWFANNKYYDCNSSLEGVIDQIYQVFLSSDIQNLKKFVKKVKNPIEILKQFKERSSNIDSKLNLLELAFDAVENLQREVDNLAPKLQNGLIRDLNNFIQDENSRDFQIQIEDKEFRVHKFLLAARSPILAETLKNNPEVENLNLVDISEDIFEQILNFIYTDELPGEGTNYLHLFAAAGRLQITDLKNFAASKLIDQVNAENIYEIFKLSTKYNHDELKQKSFNEIKANYPKIKFNDGWITEPEKVGLVIDKFKKKEEAIKRLDDEFDDEVTSLT